MDLTLLTRFKRYELQNVAPDNVAGILRTIESLVHVIRKALGEFAEVRPIGYPWTRDVRSNRPEHSFDHGCNQ
jgi:hypothetical protein